MHHLTLTKKKKKITLENKKIKIKNTVKNTLRLSVVYSYKTIIICMDILNI